MINLNMNFVSVEFISGADTPPRSAKFTPGDGVADEGKFSHFECSGGLNRSHWYMKGNA